MKKIIEWIKKLFGFSKKRKSIMKPQLLPTYTILGYTPGGNHVYILHSLYGKIRKPISWL